MNTLVNFKHWNLLVMYLLFAVIFTFEMLGVFDKHFVTITAIIKTYIPIWARAMIWGWLGWHFLIKN